MFGFTRSIRSRVMSVIENRIAGAQEEFEVRCAGLETSAEVEIEAVRAKLQDDKERLANELVAEVLAKVI